MPDMRSQRILSLKNSQKGKNVIFLSSGLIILIQGLFLAFPFFLVDYTFWCLINNVFFVLVILNVIQSMLLLNHWAGSLIYSGICEVYPKFKDKTIFSMPIMISIFFLCLIWILSSQSVSSQVFNLVSFTAGVGPIYILRWIWSKVNALANFIAILFAPIYFIFWNWLSRFKSVSIIFNRVIETPFLQSIMFVGVLNIFTWLIVIYTCSDKEQEKTTQSLITKYKLDEELRNPINWLHFILISILFIVLMFGPVILIGRFIF
jgi:hypothetical protein